MRTQSIPADRWVSYLEGRGPWFRGTHTEVHVLDPTRKRFVVTWGVVIEDLVYDAEARRLVLTGPEGFEHVVDAPTELNVKENYDGQIQAVEVVAGDGIKHILSLKIPKALGGPIQ